MFANDSAAVSVDEMRTAYGAAYGGTMGAEKAIEVIDGFLKKNPNDALALVYKGSLKTIQARDTSVPWRKLRMINEGFDLIDESITQINHTNKNFNADKRLEILMVSGLTNASVPKSFGRRHLAERNLKRLLESGEVDNLSRAFKVSVYAWMAVATSEHSEQEGLAYLLKAREIDYVVAERIWEKR